MKTRTFSDSFDYYIETIEKRNKEIIDILKKNGYTTEECNIIYEGVFEGCLENMLYLDDKIINFVIEIIKSLINNQSIEINSQNIRHIGFGSYSVVAQIGNYVLKLGRERENKVIPDDKRILQPLFRRNVLSGVYNKRLCNYIEVQNFTDTEWFIGLTLEEINEELYKIYSDMRNRGIIWNDIKKDNVARLLGRNNTKNNILENITSNKKTNIDVETSKTDTLSVGELVVIDTDAFYTNINEIHYNKNTLEYKFNERFKREKENSQSELCK